MQNSTIVMKPRKPGPTKTKFTRESANAIALTVMIHALVEGEHTRDELQEIAGISDSTVRKWLRYLSNPKRKLVYICERRRTARTGACKLVYTWGPGKQDVPVVRQTDSDYSRTYRANKRMRLLYDIAKPCNG